MRHKELQKEVLQHDEVLEFLVAESGDGIWRIDLEGLEYSQLAAAIYQSLGLEQLTPSSKALNSEDLDRAIQNLQMLIADPTHSYDQMVRYQLAEGPIRWVHTRGMAIRSDDGKAVRMLGTYTDVTEQKQVTAELEQQRQNANQRNRYLVDFAAIASHDLKAPLRRIFSLTGLLEAEFDRADKSALKLMDMIKSNTEVMQRNFDDLLELARLETAELTRETVGLESIVAQALTNLGANEWQGEIRVERLPNAHGDAALLTALVQHLISNSMVYFDCSNPAISISGGELQDTVWFCVDDNGIGIAPEYQERIFDAFQRLNARDAYHKGTGLGLTMCERILEIHQGSIEVCSALGEGTRMKVQLPR